MNLNEDFIAIQGILIGTEKRAGPLNKIKYRGGNESVIVNLVTELHKFLSQQKYIIKNVINDACNQKLKEICLFLVLNTQFKEALDEPNLQHLINITPQLSTCLLANVILGLELSKYFCESLYQFDATVIEQILLEVVPCLKKCKPKVHVVNAHEFIKLVVVKISTSSDSSGNEKLSDHASQMLLNLTGVHGDQIENVRIDSVYECMGRSLLNLLDLLLIINEKNKNLERLMEKLIKTCCSIMTAVTIDVFCTWAELEQDGEVLQGLIAQRSYSFIEKFQKHPHAKYLISMLGSIAQKPKSVNEQIHSADAATMIKMINKADTHQKNWFVALLNTQVLMNKESTECVKNWAHLCTVEDVTRLLNMSVDITDVTARSVVLKCAATLTFDQLVLVGTRHFHHNGVTRNLNDNVNQKLILLFNGMKDSPHGVEYCKELYLLLLQNPKQTLTYTISECSKNPFYFSNLSMFWSSVKEIITINELGINILKEHVTENKPCEQNYQNYVHLFNALIRNEVFSPENITLQIILPLLENGVSGHDDNLVKNCLEIFNDLQRPVYLRDNTERFFNFLLDLMKTHRCNFMNFDGLKQEIVKLCVDIFEKYSTMNMSPLHQSHGIKSDDFFVSFYKRRLFNRKLENNVLAHFFPINFENHAETVSHLIKILPLCVTPEWILISSNLADNCGFEKTVELLCDFMILLCEVVNSQETKTEEVKCMFQGLAYYLQNLGVVIKECLQPRIGNPNEDIAITKHVCRLLRDIPKGKLKSEEGLSLASLLSDASLKSLRADKKFACLVASIHESHICKMLTQKILSLSVD